MTAINEKIEKELVIKLQQNYKKSSKRNFLLINLYWLIDILTLLKIFLT